ncbi:MAG: hypothetical protein ACRDJT_12065 [Actinomycetota bacterium]
MTLDRSDLWSSLLIRFTRASPAWAVSGNVDEGLAGEGDVDLVARPADWIAVEQEFRRWAEGNGFEPVISCPHRPGVLLLVAVGDPSTPVYKLEVLGYRHFRGARIYSAEDLVPAMEMDPRGWRRLRPGAGALIKLVPNGVTWTGGLKWTGPKAARVLRLLHQDPEGVHLGARAFGSVGGLVETAARTAGAGRWPRARMLALEGWALTRGLASPAHTLSRLRYRFSPAGRCELPLALRRRGLVVNDVAQLRNLAESHEGVSGRILRWK